MPQKIILSIESTPYVKLVYISIYKATCHWYLHTSSRINNLCASLTLVAAPSFPGSSFIPATSSENHLRKLPAQHLWLMNKVLPTSSINVAFDRFQYVQALCSDYESGSRHLLHLHYYYYVRGTSRLSCYRITDSAINLLIHQNLTELSSWYQRGDNSPFQYVKPGSRVHQVKSYIW